MCGILLALQVSSTHKSTEVSAPAKTLKEETSQSTSQRHSLDSPALWTRLTDLVNRRGPDHNATIIKSFPTASSATTQNITCKVHASVLHLRGPSVIEQPLTASDGSILVFNGELYDSPTFPVDDSASDTEALFHALFETDLTTAGRSFEDHLTRTLTQLRGEWAILVIHAPTSKFYYGRDVLGRRSLVTARQGHSFILSSVGTLTRPEVDSFQWEEVQADGLYCIDLDQVPSDNQEWNSSRMAWAPFGQADHPLVSPLNTILNTQLPSNLPYLPESSKSATLPPPPSLPETLNTFISHLSLSLQHRVCALPRQTPLGILFSGGLDCMVLAALSHSYVPLDVPIELLNVAFENPRVNKIKKVSMNADVDQSAKYDVPDRITGRMGARELKERYPGRRWVFVEVDVPFEVAKRQRESVLELVSPAATVMDLSIAIAFWFAAGGIGTTLNEDGTRVPYTSTAKALLSGLGADEQLGGYKRHATQFAKSSWQGLLEELQLDVSRISTRNLGRDDRVVSDHGREVRFPYLAEDVVTFLSHLPVHVKTDPRWRSGVGDKLLLRQVAAKLGLERAAGEAKRAVQFGARTARMEDTKETGVMSAMSGRASASGYS